MNPSSLDFWFPKLVAARLPVPKTEIVHASKETTDMLANALEGGDLDVDCKFFEESRRAAAMVGYPLFLRTGQGSGKHQWRETCYLAHESQLVAHVLKLVEWSETVDFMGLPYDVWAFRRLLRTIPVMTCDKYGGMPVCSEWRYFVKDGKVLCSHPYWPREALLQGISERPVDFDRRYEYLCQLTDDQKEELDSLARRASEAVEGAWSVDILDTQEGFFIADMAEAERSWHWDGCPKNGLLPKILEEKSPAEKDRGDTADRLMGALADRISQEEKAPELTQQDVLKDAFKPVNEILDELAGRIKNDPSVE